MGKIPARQIPMRQKQVEWRMRMELMLQVVLEK